MLYSVRFLSDAQYDLRNIAEAVFQITLEKDFTEKYVNEIIAHTLSLSLFPRRHPIYYKGLHCIQVKRYRVFYQVHDSIKEIRVHRILSAFQDYQNFL